MFRSLILFLSFVLACHLLDGVACGQAIQFIPLFERAEVNGFPSSQGQEVFYDDLLKAKLEYGIDVGNGNTKTVYVIMAIVNQETDEVLATNLKATTVSGTTVVNQEVSYIVEDCIVEFQTSVVIFDQDDVLNFTNWVTYILGLLSWN